jgi:hypothetical protein
MDVLKTGDIRMLLYSILRQLDEEDFMRCVVLADGNEIKIHFHEANNPNNCLEIIRKINIIRTSIEKGKKVVVFLSNKISFQIWKNSPNQYFIDNWNIMVYYIIYELLSRENNDEDLTFVNPIEEDLVQEVQARAEIIKKIIESDSSKKITVKTKKYEISFWIGKSK